MNNDAIIPECDAAGLPLPAHCEVVRGVQVFAQEREGVGGFLGFEFRDVDYECGVVGERFQAGNGMDADLCGRSIAYGEYGV